MKTYGEVQAVAKRCWELDIETRWWADYTRGDEVKCSVDCSDFFGYACADCEEIEAADLPLLERAHADLSEIGHEHLADLLFCCRKRRAKPMPAALERRIPPAARPLFDGCEP